MLSGDLLALQGCDTAIDQLGARRARLPEREAFTAADQARRASTERAAAISARQRELGVAVEEAETEGARLTAQRERLQGQLKTVIAPREAEALMHELATIAARRDALDDTELEHLDEESRLAGELAEVEAAGVALDESVATAGAALHATEAAIDAEVAELAARRAGLAQALAAGALADYESRRRHHGGVAVAVLDGPRCSGCHLVLSRSELEHVRSLPGGGVTDCPQCGRMLVAPP